MARKVFSLEVLPAKKGDCLLLRYGPKVGGEQRLALIDGGPGGVYTRHLAPRLKALRTEKSVPDDEPMLLDWVMLSHVDDDHANGLVQLTEELKEPGKKNFVKLVQLFHNTFDKIIDNDAAELERVTRDGYGTASLDGGIRVDVLPDGAKVNGATFSDALQVLASIKQGVELDDNAKVLGIEINLDGKGGLIVAKAGGKAIQLADGLRLSVIGPMLKEVEALQVAHRKWLKEQAKRPKPPSAALAAYLDSSVPNLSSIVVLAELGGKTILFTGDARGDKILAGLKLVGLGTTLHVDVLKVPHHGSDNNVTQEFFERVTADHYVFSGNGEHGNPERKTFDLLRKARPGADYKIYLTYDIPEIDAGRMKDWKTKQKSAVRAGKEPPPNWSSTKQGLVRFFEDHPDMKKRIVPLPADVPMHRIDLLAEL
ncbi:hypothetical protein H7K14_19750 [Mycolicibacter longobardus]|uniref:ComEC/Rec2 family competence protein n=1 Tax=Mycolicibacter longobardus TaxID=1108812 RepID=UPI0021F320D2|nr:hypothetical protein [Mycolicibacter longobardus]MCV7386054.1 hypothetical protein [Mycolicibacter longobardus]